ncbi:sugar phosphate isomerase/epimerase family protein [Vibrio splendidus]|uniref:sugar phosphate isomerase/epimerase family protein n=1 Tax=Vibrio splendidus TaxID=29497 RepID=UPI000C85EA61|nr:TIM barrel protein [Vibrio splendidus]PMH10118.1 hypothetical protein BCU75_10760 [Vibrio splendidus]
MKIGYSTLVDSKLSIAEQGSLLSVSDCIDWAPTVTNPKWDLLDDRGQATLAISKPISALQSLFFGVEDVAFLGSEQQFNNMLCHFERLIVIAKVYNVKYILWGSPGTRIFVESLTESTVDDRFRKILALFENTNIKLMVEAVSSRFGCEFINTTAQLLKFNKRMAHDNLGLHLDTGQMLDEGLDVIEVLSQCKEELEHLHLSTPDFSYQKGYLDFFSNVVNELERDSKVDIVFEVQKIDECDIFKLVEDISTVKGLC